MKKGFLVLLCIIALLGIKPLWDVFIKFRQQEAQAYYNSIENLPRFYAYDTLSGILNPVFYIEDLKDSENLISYYDASLTGENPSFSFPIKMMPYNKSLIFIKYVDKDSMIAEVVDFNTTCWGYIRGYVYSKMLHQVKAPEKLIQMDSIYWAEKEKSEGYKRIKQITGSKSPYGLQCD